MAQYNKGFGVSFNDNDGGASIFCTGSGIMDYERHVSIMGRWRARLFFARKLLVALIRVDQTVKKTKYEKNWKRLNGWQA